MKKEFHRRHPRHPDSSEAEYEYLPIEDYGIIGDLHTVALVGVNGSIDWCCLPHFDSPSVFASLLDKRKGGRWQITAFPAETSKQMYFPDTNVLITRFHSQGGVGEIVDCMPVDESLPASEKAPCHRIVRQVTAVRGEVAFRFYCEPALNYGRTPHRVHLVESGALFSSSQGTVALISPITLKRSGKGVSAEFTLKPGETIHFLLRYGEDAGNRTLASPPQPTEIAVKPTIRFWQNWLSRSHYRGRWREAVDRSLLTLKLLTYAPTGAMVAAPTCSLPEVIGGGRNWDYRYTWIRDASFTVYAFLRMGFTQEAEQFMGWLENRMREARLGGHLQVLYGIDGRQDLKESILTHFEGYRGSGPVRIGNDAYKQLQLDIYGEMMESVYLYDKEGSPISYEMWENLVRILEIMRKDWKKPDKGIWEMRSENQQNTHSKVMCWVALDRALRLADRRSFPLDTVHWRKSRDAIYKSIMRNAWDPDKKTFVQAYGNRNLDAACLLMPTMKFLSPTDPRMISTLSAIQSDLVSDTLVHRYRLDQVNDGLDKSEGTFSACSFWMVECLARAKRLDEARLMFEKMLGYGNHLGLFSEELGQSGEALGNFPQAFTHLGLIRAAYNLDRAF